MNQHEQTEPLWRLMCKVQVTEGCWTWTGSFSENFPQFYAGPNKTARPARWLLEFLTGHSLPRSTRLLWLCGNTSCVRPAHVSQVVRGDSFWRHIEPASAEDCWLWNGYIDKGGYGRSRIRSSTETSTLAHRIAFHQLRGAIPEGLELDHLCHETRCVNPWHLEPVTPAVNLSRRQWDREIKNSQSTQLIGA